MIIWKETQPMKLFQLATFSLLMLLTLLHPWTSQAPAQSTKLVSSLETESATQSSPNLLIILTDDLGYGDVSTYHPSDVATPNIDQLATQGMLFTSMRANCTVCSPSRAALLTGRYPDQVGVPGVIRTSAKESWGFLDPQVPTLANHLQDAGYHTALIGKWHLGLTAPNTPNLRGFDLFHGFLGDMMDSYTDHRRHGINYMRKNQEQIDPAGHATDIFTRWAQDYILQQSQTQQPFFLYLAYNAPHFPIQPPASWLEEVKRRSPKLDDKRALNVAMVQHLDDCIGKVLATLKESGQDRNTIVFLSSDNGGSLRHAQNNDPWRDGKTSHYDGGLRVPFMVRWPDQVKAGTRSDYAGLLFDIFPTILEVAEIQNPNQTDAVSILPILRGRQIDTQRDLYFVRREGGLGYGGKSYQALIRGNWKLMQNNPYSPLQLYDLKNDPTEQIDLSQEQPKIFRELAEALRDKIQQAGSTPWQPQN